jgi:hypothetical protein
MSDTFTDKEEKVQTFFLTQAAVDDFVRTYAYMNCIIVNDYITGPVAFNNHDNLEPAFVVTETDNDGIEQYSIIKWSTVDEYMTNILKSGCKDDIQCIYDFIYV